MSAFVSPARRNQQRPRPPSEPRVGDRVRYAGEIYTVRAVSPVYRLARIWRLPSKQGGLEFAISWDCIEHVSRPKAVA